MYAGMEHYEPAQSMVAAVMVKYAGVGSRETPDNVLDVMFKIGKSFAQKGLLLRSGGAEGADIAFEDGCDAGRGRKEIFYAKNNKGCIVEERFFAQALQMASQVHPNWGACSEYARRLHARNCFQVLGKELNDPADFVVCWTKDGGPTGGTGQAIRLAISKQIPIYNLYNEKDLVALREMYKTL